MGPVQTRNSTKFTTTDGREVLFAFFNDALDNIVKAAHIELEKQAFYKLPPQQQNLLLENDFKEEVLDYFNPEITPYIRDVKFWRYQIWGAHKVSGVMIDRDDPNFPDRLSRAKIMYLNHRGITQDDLKKEMTAAIIRRYNSCFNSQVYFDKFIFYSLGIRESDPDSEQYFKELGNQLGSILAALKNEYLNKNDEAVKIFEKMGWIEEARQVGQKAKIVKNINIDLNKLIEQLKSNGLTISYKCPSCGGPITFNDSKSNAPKFCMYCGSMIDTESISTIIQKAFE